MWRSRNLPHPPTPCPLHGEGEASAASGGEVRRLLKISLALLLLLLVAGACSDTMADQAKCKTYGQIDGFKDGACAQPLPDGVVARDAVVDNPALTTGQSDNQYVSSIPVPVTSDLLQRGHDLFTIYCQPCHGAAGYGDGVIVQYGFPAPPSFHSDGVRAQPPGFFFNVISNGMGEMYSYGQEIAVPDRWAVVAYVEALQLSQHAPAADLSAADRGQLPQ